MFKRLNNNEGVTQIIVVVALAGLLGMAALVIDVGSAMAERIQLSNAVDAAALAGAMELPTDPDDALIEAQNIVIANGVDLNDVSITVGEDSRSISVTAAKPFDFVLAPVIGIESAVLNVEAEVIIGNASGVSGLRPFGIEDQELTFGDLATLKEGGGDGETGNFGAVAFELELVGASNFIQNIMYGYDGEISIGDTIYPEPGNMASSISEINNILDSDPVSTYDNYSADSPRVWTIPVLQDMTSQGRTGEFEVVGFATFFVEELDKKAGKAEVTGRFIQFTENGEIDEDAPDRGVYAMKLVK